MKKVRLFCLMLAVLMVLGACSAQTPAGSDPLNSTGATTSTTAPTEPEVTDEIAIESNVFTVSPNTVRMLGRYHLDITRAVYGFYNSAAGITFAFDGTSLDLHLSAGQYIENWINYFMVYIDDQEPIPVRIEKDGWYTIATDLDPDVRHTVRVLKSSMCNAGAAYIHRVRLSEGAKLYSVPVTTTRKIQVIGDSITCGYGTRWDGIEEDEVTMYQGGDNSYAVLLAEQLNAELEVIAISGGGVGNNAGDKPYSVIPSYKQQDMHNGIECDFSKFVPDVVVIALGTNDQGHENPPSEFIANGADFVRFIRQQYPDALIVWTYGVMGDSYSTHIEEMIVDLRAEGEKNVYYLQTTAPTMDEAPFGQHGHPGQKTHIRMANELEAFIRDLTGWTD